MQDPSKYSSVPFVRACCLGQVWVLQAYMHKQYHEYKVHLLTGLVTLQGFGVLTHDKAVCDGALY